MGTKHRVLATALALAFVVSGMTSILLVPNGVRAADPVYHDDLTEHDKERPICWTIYTARPPAGPSSLVAGN